MRCRLSTDRAVERVWQTLRLPDPPVNPNPGISMTDKPQSVILNMDTSTYFNMLARLMGGAAPPSPEHAAMLARMAKIGLVPGQPFDMAKLDPAMQASKTLARPHYSVSRPTRTAWANGERLGRD